MKKKVLWFSDWWHLFSLTINVISINVTEMKKKKTVSSFYLINVLLPHHQSWPQQKGRPSAKESYNPNGVNGDTKHYLQHRQNYWISHLRERKGKGKKDKSIYSGSNIVDSLAPIIHTNWTIHHTLIQSNFYTVFRYSSLRSTCKK